MSNVIDFENLFSFSSEEIFGFLQRTIDEEIQKGEKDLDADLVDECVLIIEHLYGKEIYCPDKIQIDKKYKELEEKYERVKDDKTFWDNLAGDNEALKSIINDDASKKPVKHIKFKKTLLVAALVALLSLLTAVVSGANGLYNSHDSYLFGELMNIFIKKDHVVDGNIEYYNQDTNESKFYSTIEEFAKGEDIQGLCFPENLEIKKIMYSEFEGKKEIVFNPMKQNIYFCINAYTKDVYGIEFDLPSYTKTKTEKGIDVWVYEKEVYTPGTGSTQVMFKINEWYYCISTSSHEEALKLVDEFKEILQ